LCVPITLTIITHGSFQKFDLKLKSIILNLVKMRIPRLSALFLVLALVAYQTGDVLGILGTLGIGGTSAGTTSIGFSEYTPLKLKALG